VDVHGAWNSSPTGLPILLFHLAAMTGLFVGRSPLSSGKETSAATVLSAEVGARYPAGDDNGEQDRCSDIALWGIVAIVVQFAASITVRLLIHQLCLHSRAATFLRRSSLLAGKSSPTL
jgi:hypothetical protein